MDQLPYPVRLSLLALTSVLIVSGLVFAGAAFLRAPELIVLGMALFLAVAAGGPMLVGRQVRRLLPREDVSGDALIFSMATAQPFDEPSRLSILSNKAHEPDQESGLREAQRNQAMDSLRDGITHDLNNRLTVISANVDAVARQMKDQPGLKRKLLSALVASDQAAKLIATSMSFARPNEPQIQPVDLVERLEAITALLGRSLLRDTVELRVFLEEGLWPVTVDPQDLETALVTLSAHVRDLQSQGGVIDIEARNATIERGQLPDLSREGDFVQLVIRSTDPDAHEADVLAEPVLDLGEIDLSSWVSLKRSLHFLQALGGASEVHRDGTAISIVLYLPRAHDVAPLPSGSDDASVEPKDDAGDRTEILVVDDEVEVAQALQSMLEEFGYVTRVATEAGEALKSLAVRQPSLLLADFVMRGSMDGLTLAREARLMHPQLPILLMTGNPSLGDEGGEFPLLHKPILSRDLHAAIQRNLTREADNNVVPLFPHRPRHIS